MNNVSLIGRLTADPELKHTQSGIANTRFTIAVDRNFVKQGEERQADFITITAWRQTAEFVCKYFAKGRRIAIVGEIRTGSYTDKDGNKRYTFEVFANNVEFCDSKSDSGKGSFSGRSGDSERNSGYSQPDTKQSTDYREAPKPAPSYTSGDDGDFFELPNDVDLPF